MLIQRFHQQTFLQIKKKWNKIYLLFIDLYRIIYKAFVEIVKNKNEIDCKDISSDLAKQSLELMALLFSITEVDFSENDQNTAYEISSKKLSSIIHKHYINPFNEYISGGDSEVFQKAVQAGRIETYQTIKEFLEVAFRETSDEEDE